MANFNLGNLRLTRKRQICFISNDQFDSVQIKNKKYVFM